MTSKKCQSFVRCLNPTSNNTELSQQDHLKVLIVIPVQVPAITFVHTLAVLTVMATLDLAGTLGRR
ncbi:MAG TPA: hypothetical protein DDW65_07045 [Firmicutes bacterium]|nr:hypothetical protein [Bacillota bacterium]